MRERLPKESASSSKNQEQKSWHVYTRVKTFQGTRAGGEEKPLQSNPSILLVAVSLNVYPWFFQLPIVNFSFQVTLICVYAHIINIRII